MSRSAGRMIRRNKARQLVSKEYKRVARSMSDIRRLQELRKALSAIYKEKVNEHVPGWMVWVALHTPPEWYLSALHWIVEKLPPVWYTMGVHAFGLPAWAKWCLIRPWSFIGDVIGWIMVRPLLFLRKKLRTFGVSYKEYVAGPESLRVVMKFWFRVIYDQVHEIPKEPNKPKPPPSPEEAMAQRFMKARGAGRI